jgi:hypothetical protein
MIVKMFRYIPPWHGVLLSVFFLLAAITFLVFGLFFSNGTFYSCPSGSVQYNNCCLNSDNNTCANYDNKNITTCPSNTTRYNCCMNLDHICVDKESLVQEITFFVCGCLIFILAMLIPIEHCYSVNK